MKRGCGIWIGVAVVFTLMALAWSGLFYAAGKAHVETVPLAKPGEKGEVK
jgi:hypothetical protein